MNVTKEKIMRSCYAFVEMCSSRYEGIGTPSNIWGGGGGGGLGKNKLKKKSMELN